MSESLSLWSDWMLAISVQIAILVVLIALFLSVGRRFSARFRYMLWMLVLLKALTPPYLGTPWSLGYFVDLSLGTAATKAVSTEEKTTVLPEILSEILPQQHESAFFVTNTEKHFSANTTETQISETPVFSGKTVFENVSAAKILFFIWISGVFLFWGTVFCTYFRAVHVLRRGKQLETGPIFELLTRLGLRLNLWFVPQIVLSDAVKSPFLWGLFRGKIAIPADFPGEVSPCEMESVLLHELMHWKRYDMLVARLEMLVRGLFWFHPLVHFAIHKLREERESACDEAVLESGCVETRQYRDSLIGVFLASREKSLVPVGFLGFPGILEHNTQLQRRLEEIMLQEYHVKKIGLRGWFILSLFILCVVPMAAAPKPALNAEETGPEKPTAKQQILEEDAFSKRTSSEILASAREGYEKNWAKFNGNFSNGTLEQQIGLVGIADYYAGALLEAGRKDEARNLALQIKKWNETLLESAKTSQNEEEKERLLFSISRMYSLFAALGMYDDAVQTAKLSPEQGQYNAAEYLTNLAKTVARREGFKRAVPILDEAITAAGKLSRTHWRERGIIDVAEVYADVGREAKARELIEPLSEEGQARGTLMLYQAAKRNNRPESDLAALLKDAEKAALYADRSFTAEMAKKGELERMYALTDVLANSGKIAEATAIFEKTHSASLPHFQDEFQKTIGYYLTDKNRFAEAEACVDKIHSPTSKANLLSSILRQAKQTESPETIKRLVEKAEPFVNEMEPLAHRLTEQLRLAAYRMRIGETEKGRRRIDELIETPVPEEPSLTRNWRISRAVSSLAIAGMYDEAEKRIATLGHDPLGGREIWVSDAYQSLNSIRRFEEHPELWREEMKKQHLSPENDH